MNRVPGVPWLVVLSAAVAVAMGSPAPLASAVDGSRQIVEAARFSVVPDPATINPRVLAGAGGMVVTGLLFLLFFYRRRIYILFWIGGWVFFSVSMFVAARQYGTEGAGLLAYGFSQFVAILSALMFVLGADAYPTRPRLRRGWAYLLVPVLLWLTLTPLWLGAQAAFAPGHVLIAGGLAAAGVAHLLLLRHGPVLGPALVGASMLAVAASHVWVVWHVSSPDAAAATSALFFSMVPYLTAALGMQLLTFEDTTWELRRTNRRLETAQSKLRRLVITDPLTGCRNRRFFDEIIGRELQRHRRYGVPLAVMFIDVDRFKAVNDELGHDEGDRVLRQVAAFLLENIREADYVFRWGGDEFLILMSCPEEEARHRAAALQVAFQEAPGTMLLPAGVGLSIGCAEIPDEIDDVSAVVKLADARMYESKRRPSGPARTRKGPQAARKPPPPPTYPAEAPPDPLRASGEPVYRRS